MYHRRLALFATFSLVLAPIVLSAQSQASRASADAPAKSAWKAPRTEWGDPDFQGIWNNSTTTPLERPTTLKGRDFLTPEEAAQRDERTDRAQDAAPAAGDPGTYNLFWWERGKSLMRTSLIVDPPDGRLPPYTAEAQKRLAEH